MTKTAPKELPDLSPRDLARFWVKVEKSDRCWIWKAYTDKRGYGQFGIGKRLCLVHRLSWLVHYGPPPAGAFILHRCDNPKCLNPDHLFVGSQLENMKDMISKGRADHSKNPRGSRVATSKLSEDNIREIFRLHRDMGLGQRRIAKIYDVTPQAIGAILKRRVWTHVRIEPKG